MWTKAPLAWTLFVVLQTHHANEIWQGEPFLEFVSKSYQPAKGSITASVCHCKFELESNFHLAFLFGGWTECFEVLRHAVSVKVSASLLDERRAIGPVEPKFKLAGLPLRKVPSWVRDIGENLLSS